MSRNPWTPIKAKKWFDEGKWTEGFTARPHQSVDILEFAVQYHGNTACWQKALAFLKETDLSNIAPGKYPLDGENVYVSVTENATKVIEDTKWEAHRRYIDIQYVVKGIEKMGVTGVAKAKAAEVFDEIRDVGFYEIAEHLCKYYIASPETLFIFFPKDAHRPGIRAEGSEVTMKVVIKVRAV